METIINKVQLTGTVGQDPLVTLLENGKTVAQFSIGTTETHENPIDGNEPLTDYHGIEAWGELALYVEKHIGQGDKIAVEGKIRQRTYQSKGETRCCYQVVISKIILLERP